MNYVLGYILAWLIMQYGLHWLGYEIKKEQTSGFVGLFTVVSVIRSYAVRRLFNWLHHR